MDEDLLAMPAHALRDEVRKLRAGIREHRDTSEHALCWHHPDLWGLLPERSDPLPTVPEWPVFLRGCLQYRQSLDRQLPHAPRTDRPFRSTAGMKVIRARAFKADKAWGALDIANMSGITTRLHWTDQPYRWHVNDGEEVFAVLDGIVDMHVRQDGREEVHELGVGDILFAAAGCEHVAHPRGPARILVVERAGSA